MTPPGASINPAIHSDAVHLTFSPKRGLVAVATRRSLFVFTPGTTPAGPVAELVDGEITLEWSPDDQYVYLINGGYVYGGDPMHYLQYVSSMKSPVITIALTQDRTSLAVFTQRELHLEQRRLKLWCHIALRTDRWPAISPHGRP